ncbi:helix-turn-helix domain-containing protein [Pseudobdellovibrio exovorus]|uniref:DUF4115 domain-containing protein n=1 Tax=Pseudobdellovibrio exovorus JSS TaxID=1184267 RepID=M4VBF8_9BACT|nr:helix-turn-helix domain-containing protein [Pseudobdellovibrio exovorus]AGH96732.1 hypothetical protein A11Q_2516 [Pseudobdellovibrio exovorus JSS]
MKITGELLKAERVNQKLSVSEVAHSLKLTQRVVNALEAGDLDKLPAKAFVRGFVKSYAELLKMDSESVLRQFQEEMGSTIPYPKTVTPPEPEPVVETPPVKTETEQIKSARPSLKQTSQNYTDNTAKDKVKPMILNQDNRKSIIVMLSGAVGLILVILGTNKLINHFQEKQRQAEEVASAQSTLPSSATLSPIAPPIPHAEAPPAATVEATVQTAAAEVGTPAPAEVNVPEVGFEKSSEKPVELLLEAKKDVVLFYAKGNSKQFNTVRLSANQVQVLRSKVGLYLKAADGGAFKINVNGIDKGLAGAPNKEVKLSF